MAVTFLTNEDKQELQGNIDKVLYNPVELTDEQKEQARENIGAVTVDDVVEELGGSGSNNLLDGATWAMGYISGATGVNTTQNQCINGEAYTVNIIPVVEGQTYTLIYKFVPTTNNPTAWWAIQTLTNGVGQNRITIPVSTFTTDGETRIYTYTYTVGSGINGIRVSGRTNAWYGDKFGSDEKAQTAAPFVFSMMIEGEETTATNIRLLPIVTSDDNGKHMTVKEGKWTVAEENGDNMYINNNLRAVNHRGYCTVAPENTLSAYRLSKKMGFEYAECDVSFTSDGVAVLLHDSTVDRTSNGTGSISALTLEQVKALDFGSWKSSDYAGEQIPTFEEFIILCKRIGLHPYIEIKGGLTDTQATSLVATVKRYGMRGKVTWISFYSAALTAIKNADTTARLGFVTESSSEDGITTVNSLKTETNEVFIDASPGALNGGLLNLCIENNIPVEVWTINNETQLIGLDPYISGYTSDNLRANVVLYNEYM